MWWRAKSRKIRSKLAREAGVETANVKRIVKTLVVVAVLAGVVAVYFTTRRESAQPLPGVVLLDPNYKIPPGKVTLFERTVPVTKGWAWLWKLREAIVGRKKTFGLSAAIMDVSGWNDGWLANLSLPEPALTTTNGVRIWLLDNVRLGALRGDLTKKRYADFIFVPGIMTADGMEAQLSTGGLAQIGGAPVSVGLAMDVMPKIHGNVIDFTGLFRFSETVTNGEIISVQTNLSTGLRIQLTNGCGFFLLGAKPSDPAGKRIGVIGSTQNFQAQKRLAAIVSGPGTKK